MQKVECIQKGKDRNTRLSFNQKQISLLSFPFTRNKQVQEHTAFECRRPERLNERADLSMRIVRYMVG
jgi:hypothetical protein